MVIWFQNIWQWKIEPVPVLIALAMYFGPVIYLRWRRVYTPLYYFLPFLRVQIKDVHKYLGGNFFAPFLENDDEAEKLRKKTIWTVNTSALLHVILIPAFVAAIWSLFLTTTQFTLALAILLFIKACQFAASVLNFHLHSINTPKFRGWLVTFYIVVLFIMLLTMLITQDAVKSSLAAGNFIQLIWNAAKWLFWIVISGIVVGPIATWITAQLFSKEARQSNIDKKRPQNESEKTIT